MLSEKIKKYFADHPAHRQIALFLVFSFAALCSQLLSRLILDLALKNVSQSVSIWPFQQQALGSLLAFLVSNIIAKTVSYITNRKKTFAADNNVSASVVIYIVTVTVLIIVETVIGTPIQNWLYLLFGGTYAGAQLTTANAAVPWLYQLCGTLSQMLYGIGDMVIIFVMDKYVIMARSKKSAE